ncbi:rhodanese-related sulfurtransferase [Pantoea sp. Mhis]|uniref:oxygen-dependent tRNA uridine(34) hydroxylase TrhO n=1 Tax=Pantoea sp. Mhis TaxID=2576759 RepID=UPI00135A0AAD|nr:rhodanese-related sulfurtransferase [Pantoea sp. Mhis]MXP56300.1 rhodanese-related sulfurtransferase [Pantoea sp. Mhis]
MSILHNRICNKELKQNVLKSVDIKERITISFYKYFHITDPSLFRDELYVILTKLKVFGRIYIAHEGINAQISILPILYEKFKQILYSFHPELNKIRMNIALNENGISFWVLRMKVRKRIVADGIKDHNFNASNVGMYLNAKEVNSMLDDPEVMFIDMRNHYEYEVGHFENAIKIPSNTFRDQLPKVVSMLKKQKDRKIVMYCTGGIRCEKASAWMKHNGFNNVYHIEGGIIEYTRQAIKQGLCIRFKGKNFVFDGRMGERVSNEIISNCHQCNLPCDDHTNCINDQCHSLFIQCSNCAKQYHKCCSLTCMTTIGLSNKNII